MFWKTARAVDRGAPLRNRPAVLALAGVILLSAALSALGTATAQDPMLTRTVHTSSRDITLAIVYSPGDEAWAERIASQTEEALPLLEEYTGVPYPGRDELEIHEHGTEELFGYAGFADCYRVSCGISVAPGAWDDHTLFHELSHVWTQPFSARWLSEGTAEFLSWKVLAQLDPDAALPVDPGDYGLDAPPFPLAGWGSPRAVRSVDIQMEEAEGYYWSPIFFQRLEERLGPDLVRKAFAAAMARSDHSVDSRDYVDVLEDAGGGNNDEMFLTFIFSADARPQFARRRDAREGLAALTARAQAEAPELSPDALKAVQEAVTNWEFEKAKDSLDNLASGLDAYLAIRTQLADLRTAAEGAGLPYPTPYQTALTTWGFAPFVDSIPNAQPAIDAYRSAAATVAEPRSLWQRIGLAGKNPGGQLDDASDAFARAEFHFSMEKSRAAQATIVGAGGDAPLHLLIAAAVVIALATVAAVVWSRSRTDGAAPAGAPADDAENEPAAPNP